jgi:hypothetical protein
MTYAPHPKYTERYLYIQNKLKMGKYMDKKATYKVLNKHGEIKKVPKKEVEIVMLSCCNPD